MRVASVLVLWLAAAACAGAASAHPGPVGERTTRLERLAWAGRPVYCGGPVRRVFALTFDDGPGPWTDELLRVLRRRHAQATFFLVGNRIRLWSDAARAEARYGAVGNHTWSHPQLSRLGVGDIRRQLLWTQEELQERLHVQTRLFRLPYERTSPRVARVLRTLGLVDVRWNVDSGDSRRGARAGPVTREVLRHLRPGAIVLLHDAHPWTVKVVRAVLAAARHRHLRPVTVPKLLGLDPPWAGRSCYSGAK
jgi:peptidoglycan/xylan/chitin deacetylase (PgdA/CDA1 family)